MLFSFCSTAFRRPSNALTRMAVVSGFFSRAERRCFSSPNSPWAKKAYPSMNKSNTARVPYIHSGFMEISLYENLFMDAERPPSKGGHAFWQNGNVPSADTFMRETPHRKIARFAAPPRKCSPEFDDR